MQATAFAPGSIGNVGPGFDTLGLAIEGLGDRVTLAAASADDVAVVVRGRDAERIPTDPARNSAAIAARAYLRARGVDVPVAVTVDKGLPCAGGLGGSAASSVAGAFAAHLLAAALGSDEDTVSPAGLVAAAFAAESAVAGPHLDNVAAATLGGLALVRSVNPVDVVALPVGASWWLALWTPHVHIETRAARALLPAHSSRADWVQQMANSAALVHAFAAGDAALLGRALDDRYAEPRRAPLIPHFAQVKAAAIEAGAFGGSVSGSGPTVFAVAPDEPVAQAVAAAMRRAGGVPASLHVGAIARRGVHAG